MSTYRKEWDCCGGVTETEAWEPEHCPFCTDDAAPFRKDAERYRMLRDNGYLDHLCGGLHPCDEPRRLELTDAQVDRYAAMHARRLLALPNVANKLDVKAEGRNGSA